MTVFVQTCHKLSRLGSSQSVQLDSLILLEMVTGKPRIEIITNPNFKLKPDQQIKLDKLIESRLKKPIAYLIGTKEFFGLNFIVNERVLIPRPESEALVELGLKFCKESKDVYDIGSGSGCLAISYCLTNPNNTRPSLIDIDAKALSISRKNCIKHNLKAQFKLADFTQLESSYFREGGLVFANLPYLNSTQKEGIIDRCPDLAAEPALALFADGSGLGLYRKLFDKLESVENISLIVESLDNQIVDLEGIGKEFGFDLVETNGLGRLFRNF